MIWTARFPSDVPKTDVQPGSGILSASTKIIGRPPGSVKRSGDHISAQSWTATETPHETPYRHRPFPVRNPCLPHDHILRCRNESSELIFSAFNPQYPTGTMSPIPNPQFPAVLWYDLSVQEDPMTPKPITENTLFLS
jgi:hypothetical protein